MKRIYFTVAFIVAITNALAQNITVGKSSNSDKATLSGVIKDANGTPIAGATIFIQAIQKGSFTDTNGFFEMEVPVGTHQVMVSMIGFTTKQLNLNVRGSGSLNMSLKENQLELNEVVISSVRADENVSSTDLGKSVLSIKSIEEIPAFIGEVDIIKSITLLPGVSTVGEASSGFHVRGGSSSQNLILLGGATIYNPSHVFGFFSSFNSDLINDVTLYKGGIPARLGGRGSSVLEINYKNGQYDNWGGKATIGLISGKLAVEGPIIKDKLFIDIGGRSSYSDWMLKAIKDPQINNSSASFYDINGILNYQLNERNRISYSFYTSSDDFSFASDTTMAWKNQNHVLRWYFSNGDRFSSNIYFVSDNYDFSILNKTSFNQFDLTSAINSKSIKYSADVKLFENANLNAGFETRYISILPGELSAGEGSSIDNFDVEKENALESAAFIDVGWEIHRNLSISFGLRGNNFKYLGKKRVYLYEENQPKTTSTIIDSVFYDENEPIEDMYGLEPRLSLRWSLSPSTSLKFGYNKMYQYLHLISNTSTIAPTDIWKLSDSYLEPEIVDQYSLGVFKNLRNNSIETSAEVYYKTIDNIVEYKDGAELILNPHIETELLTGEGKAYGIELFLKKKTGRVTGWFSYTYSRSFLHVEGAYEEMTINDGDWYASNYDKPHDFTAVLMYNIDDSWTLASNFTYSTGRPITYPSGKFNYEGNLYAYFNDRNTLRSPDYHRLDLSLTYKARTNKILNGDWVLSIYNLYGRKNAFSVFFDDVVGSPPQAYKLSVIGIPFPSLSYSFTF